ncbi:hypothetical protein CMI37_05665 [Candidatus Pacearchaeota archaeon]|nr:hypothetical protein [Candidatus Pacearchaeota archaeon]
MKSIVSYSKNDNQVSVALDKVTGDDNSYEELLVITVNGNVFTLKFDEYSIVNNLISTLLDDES